LKCQASKCEIKNPEENSEEKAHGLRNKEFGLYTGDSLEVEGIRWNVACPKD
jgi:hypothetical protein